MSAHGEIQAKYLYYQNRLTSKRQQGLTGTDVPLTLQEGFDLVKLMLKLAEEVNSHDQVVNQLTPKGGPVSSGEGFSL